jgi:hypothetical protein
MLAAGLMLVAIAMILVAVNFGVIGDPAQRRIRKLAAMDRDAVATIYEDTRLTVVSHMRHPRSDTSKLDTERAMQLAVACLDRLDQLDGRDHGSLNKAKLWRDLERRLRREAEYWTGGDSGFETLGREQEPSIFAAGQELGPFPR